MRYLEKYTGEQTYMFPNGVLATKEAVLEQFPAALYFVHVVETDENHQVMYALSNLSSLRSLQGIDTTLSEEEAIQALQDKLNEEVVVQSLPTANERIAAALELQNMLVMDDSEEITE